MKGRRISPEMESDICDLARQGYSGPRIAEITGVSHVGVINVCMRNNVAIVKRKRAGEMPMTSPPGAHTAAERAMFRRFLGA